MGNSAEPYEVKLLNRLLDFHENLCELIVSQGITLFFIKFSEIGTLWIFYFISDSLFGRALSAAAAKREREGRPPRCSTS